MALHLRIAHALGQTAPTESLGHLLWKRRGLSREAHDEGGKGTGEGAGSSRTKIRSNKKCPEAKRTLSPTLGASRGPRDALQGAAPLPPVTSSASHATASFLSQPPPPLLSTPNGRRTLLVCQALPRNRFCQPLATALAAPFESPPLQPGAVGLMLFGLDVAWGCTGP